VGEALLVSPSSSTDFSACASIMLLASLQVCTFLFSLNRRAWSVTLYAAFGSCLIVPLALQLCIQLLKRLR
jgi:hypothetical protein